MILTPEQKIKYTVILEAIENDIDTQSLRINPDNVDELWDELDCQEELYNFRDGDEVTNVACEHSRHYESESVAAQMFDGSWVGWTHWYGGGKHGEPEAIDWMRDAYNLTCVEEEKLVVIRTFAKI